MPTTPREVTSTAASMKATSASAMETAASTAAVTSALSERRIRHTSYRHDCKE
jgi:hypothetical protein